MKIRVMSAHGIAIHSFIAAICAGSVFLIFPSARAQSQNLYVYSCHVGPNVGFINEYQTGGNDINIANNISSSGVGMAVNSAGDVFVSDEASGNIYEYTPGGVQSTFASGVVGSLAADSAGDVFVSDEISGNIYRYTPGGAQSTFAPGVGAEELTFDDAGNLWATGGGNIYRYTAGGAQNTILTGVTGGGLAVDNVGNMFLSGGGYGGGQIYEYTPGGTESTFSSTVSFPTGPVLDGSGNLWVGAGSSGIIDEYSPDGDEIYSFFADADNVLLAFQPVPEPSTIGLLVTAGATAFLAHRRGRSRLT